MGGFLFCWCNTKSGSRNAEFYDAVGAAADAVGSTGYQRDDVVEPNQSLILLIAGVVQRHIFDLTLPRGKNNIDFVFLIIDMSLSGVFEY